MISIDERFMQIALQSSHHALPDCLPNPPVGCVFVKNNSVVANGYTQACGQATASALSLSHARIHTYYEKPP